MVKRSSAVAVSCFVFMCSSAARADLLPVEPKDLPPEKPPGKQEPAKDAGTKKSSKDNKAPGDKPRSPAK